VGSPAERIEQRGVEANLDDGHRHDRMVTAEAGRTENRGSPGGPDVVGDRDALLDLFEPGRARKLIRGIG
jgi:hypothetical protein